MTHKCGDVEFVEIGWRRRVQICGQVTHDGDVIGHIRVRNRIAFGNAERCADGLSVLAHKLSGRDRARGETMAGIHLTRDRDGVAVEL